MKYTSLVVLALVSNTAAVNLDQVTARCGGPKTTCSGAAKTPE